MRYDNGQAFVAEAVRRWVAAVEARTAFVAPGSHWEYGYLESVRVGQAIDCPAKAARSTPNVLRILL